MSARTIFVFFICSVLTVVHSIEFEADFASENYKVVGESSFFESRIWTEYSELLSIDDSDAFCEDSRDIIFPDTSTKNIYYRCQNGRKELYQCIEGFEFDSNRLRCTPQRLHFNDTSAVNDCYQQMDGFYPDYKCNCQEYFRCKNGIKVERLSCPPYQAFSFHSQLCQLEKEVTCVKSVCEVGNDDFFVLPGSKCQAYYYCKRGVRSDFICPKGSIFNRQTKTCVESGICYEPVCTGRIDGLYADTTHECTRSFECRGGMLQEVKSCGPGQKYDGYSCIAPPFKTCEKAEKTAAAFYFRANDECKSLSDGSHIVPGTDCRNVRICIRGKTSAAFECPRDQRFNGNRCFTKDVVPCDDVCSMKSDGYYADEFTNCQGYYSCISGKISRRKQCPIGTAFNGHMCAPTYVVSCPKKSRSPAGRCLGLRDGFHPDYLNSCRNYFYCYNHEMVLTGSCTAGIWNGKQCSENKNIVCEGPSELEECNGLSPGLYQNKTSGCTRYFYCNNGSGTMLSCPPGLLFNGDKCVNADEYTCETSNECVNEPDGYRQDKNTACRSYYYCSNGNKITYVCPDGFIFNGTYCVPSQTYKCPFTPSSDCVGKQDGYHADKLSDCKKYFYCFNGEKLTTLACGGKKVFDGQGCVLSPNPKSICFGTTEPNPCRQKKDGIYTDQKTECRKYYSCRNRTMSNESWCPRGYGFNGNTCIKDFSCNTKTQSSICQGNFIGFYQDLASNCRNYYFCLGGIQTLAACPGGTIFNGQLCIDANYYRCPSVKS